MIPTIELPAKLEPVFQPKRYKVLYGGRGGGKSQGVALALLTLGAQKPLRILCARELQKSIKDSVLKLLADLIKQHNLHSFYEIQTATVKGINGTEFIFEGLRHNIESIKSKEGIDIVWIEEAQTVSKNSWDILIPTIRKEKSEIWMTFNPNLESDETYQRFVVDPPKDSIVIDINWQDNPWFPQVLELERIELKEKNYDEYLHVWEGKCKQALEGAVFMHELRVMEQEDKIMNVPYDPNVPVQTYWDLGYSDMNTIWFVQKVGMQYRFIDYYENNLQNIAHYVKVLNSKPYVYGTDWIPHDGDNKALGSTMTIQEQLRKLGRKPRIVQKVSIPTRIQAGRAIFPMCVFDRQACADGINALRHWSYKVDDETGQFSNYPVHNWASHAADSFTYFAMSIKQLSKKDVSSKQRPARQRRSRVSGY